MGFRVKVQPSGHEFLTEPQETLLESALRSGINISYNCSGGSCGVCKVKVIEGKSEDRVFHDYRLSEQEIANGVILLCTHHAASDMVVEAREAHGAADIGYQRITTRVAKIEQLNPAIYTLLLRTPRSQTLRFLAGQHVELRSGSHMIDLPIASCPCNGMLLQFHLRIGKDEPFASHLLAQGQTGSSVVVEGPFGDFVLDDDSPRPMVMIAEDTGFAAIKGLVEHAITLEKPQPLRLYRIATGIDALYMANYCESWRDALDDYTYSSRLVSGEAERLTALQEIAAEAARLPQPDVYIAVARSLQRVTEEIFLAAGIPAERIFFHRQRVMMPPLQPAALP